MRKSQVLRSEPCEPPEYTTRYDGGKWWRGPKEIHVIAKAQIIWPTEESDILNIDVFRDGMLKARYFADKRADSHRVLIMETGDWKQLILQNVANIVSGAQPNYSETNWGCDYIDWCYDTDEDKEAVKGYLGQDIMYWEHDIMAERRYRQLANKQTRIDTMMAAVIPDIPQDFYRWIHEDVFGIRHLFQEKLAKMTRITCTACGKRWRQKKSMGLGMKVCPKCGKTVKVTYKKAEHSAETALYLLQPCSVHGRWVERHFRARCTWTPEHVSQVKIDEQIRAIVPNGKTWGTVYYEDGVHSDGTPRFRDANARSRRMTSGYLYPGTLPEMAQCWPETLTHSGMGILAEKGVKFNVNHMIVQYHGMQCMEYIIKGGFYRLAAEMMTYMYPLSETKMNIDGTTSQEVLRLTHDRVNRLRQMDGGLNALGWLQYEQRIGKKISQANIIELGKHGIHCNDDEVWRILSYVKSPDVFANYIRKQSKLQKESRRQIISEWVDYLDMAKKQRLNLSHEMFYKPKDLKAAHDACVKNAQHEELKWKAEGILEKFPDVEKIMDSIRDKYTYDGKDFSIVVPADVIDIIHEGRALGHCIDTTDRYFDRIQNHISYLVFLRRSSQKDTPYYTLEIEPGGTIRQQRTTGNNQNKEDVKEYSPFIREWQRVVRDRIGEEDRRLAEVSRQTRIREYQELRDKQEKVWRGALAGKLLVDVLEADLIEAM